MKPAILTIDVEDWHQLVHRRLGRDDWDRARPEFPRQMEALFQLLGELGAKPTMFLLGMTVARYPEVVREIVTRGYEIASHGYAHRRVYTQSEAEFREDVLRSIDAIGEATGKRPAGYRAPEFSINRDTPWAYDVLAELGFRYDSSQHDNRRIPNRIEPPAQPYRLELPTGGTLWELPTPSVGPGAGGRRGVLAADARSRCSSARLPAGHGLSSTSIPTSSTRYPCALSFRTDSVRSSASSPPLAEHSAILAAA